MEENLYFAYGSNLDLEQMAQRCPDAEIVGPVRLENYELRFSGSGFATVAPRKGSVVYGLVWKITPNCEQSLDRYEGYPRFYRRDYVQTGEIFDVLTGRVVSSSASAMIYLMQPGHPLGLPSGAYWQTCLQGYRDFHFDPAVLRQALKDSAPQ